VRREQKKKLSAAELQAAGLTRDLVVREVRGPEERSESSRRHENPTCPGARNKNFTGTANICLYLVKEVRSVDTGERSIDLSD
jgi:hypothetical protein